MKLNVNECVGCGACYSVCPRDCIAMKNDGEGFLYPAIDKKKCVGCDLCEKVCPILRYDVGYKFDKIAYACYTNNEDIRIESSSGGIFTELARIVLERGGVVFGAAFSNDFMSVGHICVEKSTDLDKLRGSKYVQSDIGDTYKKVKDHLNGTQLVLFTGTPCQIAGLNGFLQREYDNLITQDLICHGVPSPFVWQKYVEYRNHIANSNVKKISFRNKQYGWKNFSVKFDFNNNTQYIQKHRDDMYMQGFLKNYYLRHSCYNCKFKNGNANSDITLADFWGIENVLPNMYKDSGISLIIINSKKGEKLFNLITKNLVYEKASIEQVKKYNTAYIESVKLPKIREKVVKNIRKYGFCEGFKKSLKPSLKNWIVFKVRQVIGVFHKATTR